MIPLLAHPTSNSMTVVSNDASWWPFINADIISSCFAVAACAAVIYDWVLTFGQEVELVWRQRWSLMTVLYLIARYLGIGFVVMRMLFVLPTVSMTDAGCVRFSNNLLVQYIDSHSCLVVSEALALAFDIVNVILGVIMIVRLHAMYQRSRKMLIFLIAIFLAIRIANAVMAAITMTQYSGEELILSGTYHCNIDNEGDSLFLSFMNLILVTVWEVLALCLAVWIAVKHFRELRRYSTRGVIGDCFTVLMKTHVSYFASFFAFACLNIGLLCPTLLAADILIPDVEIYYGFSIISATMQLSVLGPRLILSVREYHAKLVADSDTTSTMTSIAFQDRIDVENNSSV